MVRIIAVKHISDYIISNQVHASVLEAWLAIVKKANWEKPQDMFETFGAKAVDILGKKDKKKGTVSSNRAVFDVKGNHLRIIVKYQFKSKGKKTILYLKWIGTHKAYDEICKSNDQYDINMFKSEG